MAPSQQLRRWLFIVVLFLGAAGLQGAVSLPPNDLLPGPRGRMGGQAGVRTLATLLATT